MWPARMIKLRTMMSDDAPRTGGAPSRRPRRTLSLADRLVRVPIGFLWLGVLTIVALPVMIYMTCLYWGVRWTSALRSEEHTSELQSRLHLVCRLLLEKKKKRLLPDTRSTTEAHYPTATRRYAIDR